MTVRELLEVANSHTGVEIWYPDGRAAVNGYAVYLLQHEFAILDQKVAEFEIRPFSSDSANLVIYAMW